MSARIRSPERPISPSQKPDFHRTRECGRRKPEHTALAKEPPPILRQVRDQRAFVVGTNGDLSESRKVSGSCFDDEALSTYASPNNPRSKEGAYDVPRPGATSASGAASPSSPTAVRRRAQEILAIRRRVRQQQQQQQQRRQYSPPSAVASPTPTPPPTPPLSLAPRTSRATLSGVRSEGPVRGNYDENFESDASDTLCSQRPISLCPQRIDKEDAYGESESGRGHGMYGDLYDNEGLFLRNTGYDIARGEIRSEDNDGGDYCRDEVFRRGDTVDGQHKHSSSPSSRQQKGRGSTTPSENGVHSQAVICPMYAVGTDTWEAESRHRSPGDDRYDTDGVWTNRDMDTTVEYVVQAGVSQVPSQSDTGCSSNVSGASKQWGWSGTVSPCVVSRSEHRFTVTDEVEDETLQLQQQHRNRCHLRPNPQPPDVCEEYKKGMDMQDEKLRDDQYRRECAVLAGTAKIVLALSALEYRRMSARFYRWKRLRGSHARKVAPFLREGGEARVTGVAKGRRDIGVPATAGNQMARRGRNFPRKQRTKRFIP